MTDVTHPPGWWMASDGNWYPPHLYPGPPRPADRWTAPVGPTSVHDLGSSWPPPGASPPGQIPEFPAFAPSMDGPPGYGYAPLAPQTNGLAVASLVLSIVSLVGIGSIVGIVLGFVSRAQIRRSHGAQKGSGLGLAGIIVGFVTLALVLAAVAIPTFLGVEASSAPVVHLPLTAITLGDPQQGGPAAPMAWEPKSQVFDTTVTPVDGGVEVAIASPGHAEYVGAPVEASFPAIEESASVAIISGPSTNGIGLGCMSASTSDQLAFFIRGSGEWQIMEWTSNTSRQLDYGFSDAIRPTGTNTVTIACRNDSEQPMKTQLSFEVNGTPVANDLVPVTSAEWLPTVQLCSCNGPDVGRYLDMGYYSTPSSSSPAT
jgi:hypothetical protein